MKDGSLQKDPEGSDQQDPEDTAQPERPMQKDTYAVR